MRRWLVGMVALAACSAGSVDAQSGRTAEVRVDGRVVRVIAEADAFEAASHAVVDSLRRAGYYFARVDSLAMDGSSAHLSAGPLVRIGAVRFAGVDDAEADRLRRTMETREGLVLDQQRLELDLEAILVAYERAGRPLAEAVVAEMDVVSEQPPEIGLTIRLIPGPLVPLGSVELPGAERTRASFAALLGELEIGRPLRDFDPDAVRRRLENSGLFDEVGEPELLVGPDTMAVVRIPVIESDPGTFDLVLGYLPPSGREQATFVGNGHLALRNLFGRGRSLSLRLNRMPDQVSSVEVRAADPHLFASPLGTSGSFYGLEQDSTFGKQVYRGEATYRVQGGLVLSTGFAREQTRPGQAGIRLTSAGRQVIPQSEAWFFGIGTRFARIDRPLNPTRGAVVEINLETGRKVRSERRVAEADTTHRRTLLRQERLHATGRTFFPAFARQVLVVGGDLAILSSNEYDRSDLFRFGGARSLRGYDEDRFTGRIVGRVLIEYRLLVDRFSFAYLFADLGFVDRPETADLVAARGFHPGYGFGIQFRTTVGLVNVSAAFNPEGGPTDARIHAGLSFGL